MVNKKITELNELINVASADVVAVVDDPSGSPETKKITYSNLESGLSHLNIQDIGTLTHSQLESNQTTISGAGVTNTGNISTNTSNITNLSGTVVVVSGATVTNANDITTTSGVLNTVSGATVTNATNITTISGATVTNSGATATNASDITTISGATVTNSGATFTNAGDITTISGVLVTVSGAGATHQADSSDPHGTTLTQTNISSTGLISGTTLTEVVGDHGTNTNPEIVNVVYDTSATPPTASTTTEGTLFVQYTA